MTEEEYFRKNYPDFCYYEKPLSPYWDLFQDGVEFGEQQSEKKIGELKQQIEKMKSALIDIKSNTDDVNIEWQIKYLFDELEIKE